MAGELDKNYEFEWHELKRLSNIEKHEIDFDDASIIFSYPSTVHIASQVPSQETRYLALGILNEKIIAVIYVRRGQAIRII
jgi:uncharacterized protein